MQTPQEYDFFSGAHFNTVFFLISIIPMTYNNVSSPVSLSEIYDFQVYVQAYSQ